MHAFWGLAVCIASVYPLSAVKAQNDADSLAIELAAARAMLGHQYNKGSISIDPVEGAPGHAPSNPGVGSLRSPAHTEKLAKAISGSVRRYADLTRCNASEAQCPMSGVNAHLVLSAPNVRGDTARVTATIYQNSPSKQQPVDYETVLLTLVRAIHGWVVVEEVQLGIS